MAAYSIPAVFFGCGDYEACDGYGLSITELVEPVSGSVENEFLDYFHRKIKKLWSIYTLTTGKCTAKLYL